MQLQSMIVADPSDSSAELTAAICERLAARRIVALDAEQTLARCKELRPELAVVSLELAGMPPALLVQALHDSVPETFVVATYRELPVAKLQKLAQQLARLGVEDLLPHPIDAVELFRIASRRFNVHFRRHDRYAVSLDVVRADGVTIGKTIDLSEGGLRMSAFHPMNAGESLLLDLQIGEGKPLRVRCHVLSVEGKAPASVTARVQFARLFGPEHRRLIEFIRDRQPTRE